VEPETPDSRTASRRWYRHLPWLGLSCLHIAASLGAFGGWAELTSAWPIPTHDHPVHFHYATITPSFLRQSGTTAGYDPSFMAGYAKSVIFPQSSTIGEVVAFLTPWLHPAVAYKATVFIAMASLPLWLAGAGWLLGLGAGSVCVAVGLFLVYFWTDFPRNYAMWGMHAYLLAMPMGVWTVATVANYLNLGGFGRWVVAALACSLVVLVHVTSPLVVAPAVLAVYLAAGRNGFVLPRGRHVGYWLLPVVVLALNAFWWWPGIRLASTMGESGFVFRHEEGVLLRLGQIVGLSEPIQPEIQAVLWSLGMPGLWLLSRDQGRRTAWGVGVYALMGLGFGYLAGFFRVLDFLQPGRQTYALYSALSLAAGAGAAGLYGRLKAVDGRLAGLAALGSFCIFARLFTPEVAGSLQQSIGWPGGRAGQAPMLSSRPPATLRWLLSNLERHVARGERILYEEGGFGDQEEAPKPFGDGRYSGLLPYLAGVEVIGGPYLHAAIDTNGTQFGEGRLYGRKDWDRDWFVKGLERYGPSAIMCWSPHARDFCRTNPDLVEVIDDTGTLLFGRIRGAVGLVMEGGGTVKAAPGRLRVQRGPGELDGGSVLRYHFVPTLRAVPAAGLRPVGREGDSVPFIGIDIPASGTDLSLQPFP
jgi:hypothetical protein